VLAMLEGLKGDAGEVTRLATPAPAEPPAILVSPNGAPATSTKLRRVDPPPRPQPPARCDSCRSPRPTRRSLPAGWRHGCRPPTTRAVPTGNPGPPGRWPRLPAVAARRRGGAAVRPRRVEAPLPGPVAPGQPRPPLLLRPPHPRHPPAATTGRTRRRAADRYRRWAGLRPMTTSAAVGKAVRQLGLTW
jgi:hypothetical protein